MNAKARALGMNDTAYRDPTGLSSQNRSSARDLVRLMRAAWDQPLIREYSTAGELAALEALTGRGDLRLEQERIPWDWALPRLRSALD